MNRQEAWQYLSNLLTPTSGDYSDAGVCGGMLPKNVIVSDAQRLQIQYECCRRLVSIPTTYWRKEYKRLIGEIAKAYSRADLDWFFSFVFSTVKHRCGGPSDDWVRAQLLPDYQVATFVLDKPAAAMTMLATIPGKLTSDLPLIATTGSATTTRANIGFRTLPPSIPVPPSAEPAPMPLPGGPPVNAQPMSNTVSLIEKSFAGFTYVAASPADAAGIMATLAIAGQVGTKVTGTKDFSGAHWSVINNINVTPESSDPALLLSAIVANGDGIIMTADADSTYITATKFIEEAARLAPAGQTEVFVLQDPAGGWQMSVGPEATPPATSDGTAPVSWGLYLGIGVGAAAAIGLVAYLATRKS